MDGIPDAHHHRLNHGQAEEGGDRGINSVSTLSNSRASRSGFSGLCKRMPVTHHCEHLHASCARDWVVGADHPLGSLSRCLEQWCL